MKHLVSLSERAREFAATAARMEREREGAAEVVAGHLRNTPLDQWPNLANAPSLRNNAASRDIDRTLVHFKGPP